MPTTSLVNPQRWWIPDPPQEANALKLDEYATKLHCARAMSSLKNATDASGTPSR